tara:strand:+ start:5366 stop:11086 length:5721 start_codon:yes stop_codon:yes gene_type:complete
MERPEVVDPLEEEEQPIFRQTPVEELKPIDTQTEDAFSVRGLAEKRLGKVGTGALDFVPIAGDILAAGDVVESYKKGDVLGTAINSAAFAVGLIPVVGDVAAKGLKAGLKATRAEKSDVPDIWSYPEQMYASSGTSLNQIPAGYKELKKRRELKKGQKVVDIGGGRFDKVIEDASVEGIDVKVFDPFNRTPEHNAAVADAIREGQADVAMSHNVLNVIKEDANINTVIQQAENAVKPGGKAHFSVYEGDGKGVGGVTQKGGSFQRNQKTVDYVPFVEKVFGAGNVTRKGKIITATKPIEQVQEQLKKFKSPKGTIFKRGGKFGGLDFPVGKVIGGNQVYFHKNYIGSQPREVQDLYNSALGKLPPDHNFNTLMYMKGKGDTPDTIRFDESADFDTAREPTPGKMIAVDANGNVAERNSNQIFHHKWMWVGDDHKGFDVNKEYGWSKQWTSKVDNFSGIGKKENWDRVVKEKGLEVDTPIVDNVARAIPPKENQSGFIAFHGSGKNFDEFKLDKVGTGEGQGVFGYGLNFTESQAIADFYKGAVGKELRERGDKNFEDVKDIDPKTYLVSLSPKDDQLIDYSLPLSKQSKKVQKALEPYYKEYELKKDNLPLGEGDVRFALTKGLVKRETTIKDKKTQDALDKFVKTLKDAGVDPSPEEITALASKINEKTARQITRELSEKGVKGIKYKAGTMTNIPEASKKGVEDANNYVIFDTKLINILAKYGIVGGVSVTALAKGQQDRTTEDVSAARGGAIKTYKEGGVVPMQEQMEMAFMNEGGVLADDGVERDPVSGNEVPAGSMAEEVRDDVPAMLSEGEYVVPADVVRFHGIQKFEELRDEAKMGLSRMEADGRIGGQPVEEQEEFPFPVEELEGFNEGGSVGDTYSDVMGSDFKAGQPYGASEVGRFPGVGFELRNFTNPKTGKTVVIPFFNGMSMQYIPPDFLQGGSTTTQGGTADPVADERDRQEDEAERARASGQYGQTAAGSLPSPFPEQATSIATKSFDEYSSKDWRDYIAFRESKTGKFVSGLPILGNILTMQENAAKSFARKALIQGENPSTGDALTNAEASALMQVTDLESGKTLLEKVGEFLTGKKAVDMTPPIDTELRRTTFEQQKPIDTKPAAGTDFFGIEQLGELQGVEAQPQQTFADYGAEEERGTPIAAETVAEETKEIVDYAWVVVPGVNANKKFKVDKKDLHLVGASSNDSARAILATDKHGFLNPVLRKTTGKGNLIQVHSEGPEDAKVLSKENLARYSGANVNANAAEVQNIIDTNADRIDNTKKSWLGTVLDKFSMQAGASEMPKDRSILTGTGEDDPYGLKNYEGLTTAKYFNPGNSEAGQGFAGTVGSNQNRGERSSDTSDLRYASFDSLEAGFRALSKDMRTKAKPVDLKNPNEGGLGGDLELMFLKYLGGGTNSEILTAKNAGNLNSIYENAKYKDGKIDNKNVKGYIDKVIKDVGSKTIDVNNEDQMIKLITSVVQNEKTTNDAKFFLSNINAIKIGNILAQQDFSKNTSTEQMKLALRDTLVANKLVPSGAMDFAKLPLPFSVASKAVAEPTDVTEPLLQKYIPPQTPTAESIRLAGGLDAFARSQLPTGTEQQTTGLQDLPVGQSVRVGDTFTGTGGLGDLKAPQVSTPIVKRDFLDPSMAMSRREELSDPKRFIGPTGAGLGPRMSEDESLSLGRATDFNRFAERAGKTSMPASGTANDKPITTQMDAMLRQTGASDKTPSVGGIASPTSFQNIIKPQQPYIDYGFGIAGSPAKPATQSRQLGLSPGAMGGRAAPSAPTPDFLQFEQDRTISAPPKKKETESLEGNPIANTPNEFKKARDRVVSAQKKKAKEKGGTGQLTLKEEHEAFHGGITEEQSNFFDAISGDFVANTGGLASKKVRQKPKRKRNTKKGLGGKSMAT